MKADRRNAADLGDPLSPRLLPPGEVASQPPVNRQQDDRKDIMLNYMSISFLRRHGARLQQLRLRQTRYVTSSPTTG